MNKQQIGLVLVMKELNVPLSVDEFNQRLAIQKAVYLAQAAGVSLGYDFQWYIRGPYCSDTAGDAFAINAELTAGNDDSKEWHLDAGTKSILTRVASMFKVKANALARHLELLASVHYLVVRRGESQDAATLHDLLLSYDKHFTIADIGKAVGLLTANGLLKAQGNTQTG